MKWMESLSENSKDYVKVLPGPKKQERIPKVDLMKRDASLEKENPGSDLKAPSKKVGNREEHHSVQE